MTDSKVEESWISERRRVTGVDSRCNSRCTH